MAFGIPTKSFHLRHRRLHSTRKIFRKEIKNKSFFWFKKITNRIVVIIQAWSIPCSDISFAITVTPFFPVTPVMNIFISE